MGLIPDDIAKAAQAAQAKTGIPASISLAQWATESGWGKHMPDGSNNPFGMKARHGKNDPVVSATTREVIKGKEVFVDAGFRKFPSVSDAFQAHGELLNQPVYAKARAKLPDVDAFADALTGLYATDPHYGMLLKSIIAHNDLKRFDVKPKGGK